MIFIRPLSCWPNEYVVRACFWSDHNVCGGRCVLGDFITIWRIGKMNGDKVEDNGVRVEISVFVFLCVWNWFKSYYWPCSDYHITWLNCIHIRSVTNLQNRQRHERFYSTTKSLSWRNSVYILVKAHLHFAFPISDTNQSHLHAWHSLWVCVLCVFVCCAMPDCVLCSLWGWISCLTFIHADDIGMHVWVQLQGSNVRYSIRLPTNPINYIKQKGHASICGLRTYAHMDVYVTEQLCVLPHCERTSYMYSHMNVRTIFPTSSRNSSFGKSRIYIHDLQFWNAFIFPSFIHQEFRFLLYPIRVFRDIFHIVLTFIINVESELIPQMCDSRQYS